MEIKKIEEKEDKITLIINNEESKITSLIKGIIISDMLAHGGSWKCY